MPSPTAPLGRDSAELAGLRQEALDAVRRYAERALVEPAFVPGETWVSAAGKDLVPDDLTALSDAVLDGWLTEGRFASEFAGSFARTIGRANAALVGSGSQANLLAVAAGMSHLHEAPLRRGDEVLTAAIGFPTTVTPLYQHGLVPVYVDVEEDTYNPSLAALEEAIGPRTRAVVLGHCLGNPFDAVGLADLCREHGLVLVEDCCDALGSTLHGRRVGTFGQASTYSFYPAHHMTTGEGGAVGTDDETWGRAVASLREWGRDCWCPPGQNDVCGRRFEGRFGELPPGYDHKYVFSHVGFNLKVTDMQAALGLSQLARVDDFHARRRRNFKRMNAALGQASDRLVLPRALPGADPSWFGYPIALREGGSERRRTLQRWLLERRIDSRLLLAGNLVRQPGFLGLEHRVAGTLEQADRITESALWVGCHHGLGERQVDWIAESLLEFVGER
jgi:CDP-6-deoxy-D-xylo-4-hexulose-3-dehydrase